MSATIQVGITYAIDVPRSHLHDVGIDTRAESTTCQIHIVQLAGGGALGYILVTGRSGIAHKRLYMVSNVKMLREVTAR